VTGDRDDRSGLPSPVALAVTLAASVAAGWLDQRFFNGVGRLLSTVFVLGCLIAVAAVRLRGVLVAMLTTPLVLIAAVVTVVLAFTGQHAGSTATMLAVARPVVLHFPVMAGATVLVLAVGGFRLARHRRAVRATTAGAGP
jgi:hypothetical protein